MLRVCQVGRQAVLLSSISRAGDEDLGESVDAALVMREEVHGAQSQMTEIALSTLSIS
jgi:hypothetical protein